MEYKLKTKKSFDFYLTDEGHWNLIYLRVCVKILLAELCPAKIGVVAAGHFDMKFGWIIYIDTGSQI